MISVILGAAFGLIGGMGLGGGMVLVPGLIYFLGTAQHEAQRLSLLIFLPMAACALFFHFKGKRVCLKESLITGGAGAVAALLGAYLAGVTDGGVLKMIFGGVLALLGALKLIKMLIAFKKAKKT